jgi:phosphoadenosine phosphosulfate reductase
MSTSLTRLQSFYGELKAPLLLHAVIKREFPGSIALLTACKADSGLLLAMAAAIDPALPVLCLQPNGHSPETLEYSRILATHLGLIRMRWITPAPGPEPLAHILDEMGILALITGRTGQALQKIALDETGVFRIHPLAGWTEEKRMIEMQKLNLPPHPLGIKAGTESQALAAVPDAIDASAVSTVDWHV